MVTFRSPLVALAALALVAATATSARAQFPMRGSDVIGEDYNVEVSFNFWSPTPTAIISSEALGILGTNVDLVGDLGIEKQLLKDVRVVLRPAKKHRFRINYLPMTYDAQNTLTREFIFNGLRYRPGLPVATTAQFKAWRFGYEYDFLYRERGFLGVLFDVKYTDVNVGLNSPIGDEFTKAVAPLPTIGGVARVYAARNLALNAEMSYVKVPENLSDTVDGRYVDFDINATFNPHKNFGVQAGYRSIDLTYAVDLDSGSLTFKGLYFGGTVRF
ncbi:MAG: hypothetical protein KA371_15670 [Acidobacteria bacterium]|nr:hypothetical protein [Acidobacteriota bacterium]